MSCSFVQPDTKGFWVKRSTGMTLIDLQKAFDTLDHNILLDKMKHVRFTSKAIDWCRSYLKMWNTLGILEKPFWKQKFWIGVSLKDQY